MAGLSPSTGADTDFISLQQGIRGSGAPPLNSAPTTGLLVLKVPSLQVPQAQAAVSGPLEGARVSGS